MDTNKKVIPFDFVGWIQKHHNQDYQIIVDNEQLIRLVTDYGEATIRLTKIEQSTIVEFSIVSKKDDSVKFYLHFELNDEAHAKQLYDEMVETLIGLKDEKTIRVLLSCSAGLTTSMFAQNLNDVAQMLRLDYHFDAVSYLSIYEEVDKYDVVFIAPQIGYMLNRLKESLTDKLVLQIPTAIFASYDASGALRFLQNEIEHYYQEKSQMKQKQHSHCTEYDNRILSIVISHNKAQTRIYYRLCDKCEIIDHNMIIKPSLNVYDLYDIIDTVLLKHQYIDMIGIATPGMVQEGQQLRNSSDEKILDIKNDFEKKYNIKVFVCNNANAAVMGFALEHREYQNIIFHSQPFGFAVGGQGIMCHGQMIQGKNGVAGEVRYFIRRMQFSDDCSKLAWSHAGVLELLTKSLLPSLCIFGPEAVAIYSPMTQDKDEIKEKLRSFLPDDFMPEFYLVKEVSPYMLDGLTKLCVNELESQDDETRS